MQGAPKTLKYALIFYLSKYVGNVSYKKIQNKVEIKIVWMK